jgi:hypothetical protein
VGALGRVTNANFKDFQHAALRLIDVTTNDRLQPPTGKHWLLLYGTLYHVTGADTIVWISKDSSVQLSVTAKNLYILNYILSVLN